MDKETAQDTVRRFLKNPPGPWQNLRARVVEVLGNALVEYEGARVRLERRRIVLERFLGSGELVSLTFHDDNTVKCAFGTRQKTVKVEKTSSWLMALLNP